MYLIKYDRKSIRIRNSGKNKKLRKKLFCLSLQCCYSEHTVLLLLFCVQSLWQWINIWLPSDDFATTSNLCCITFEDIRTTFTKPECIMAVLVVMQNVNVWNCFSFKLILVSLNNGQLMYGKPCTVFKWQPCWELFFKAQGFPYQLSHNHITNVTSIHILCGLVQLNLDEDQGIVQGLLTEWLLHGRNVLIWPSTKFEGHSGLMTTCAISAYHQVIWIKSSYA